MKSLEETLAYRNEPLVQKFAETYGLPLEEAEDLFLEAKRWLWLQARHNQDLRDDRPETPPVLFISASLGMLDEAWHAFILFTRDYMLFCRDYLGEYIHHQPNTGESEYDYEQFRELMRQTMSYVYDCLGPETLTKWYGQYQDAYGHLEVRFTPRSGLEQASAAEGSP